MRQSEVKKCWFLPFQSYIYNVVFSTSHPRLPHRTMRVLVGPKNRPVLVMTYMLGNADHWSVVQPPTLSLLLHLVIGVIVFLVLFFFVNNLRARNRVCCFRSSFLLCPRHGTATPVSMSGHLLILCFILAAWQRKKFLSTTIITVKLTFAAMCCQ